MLGSFKILAPFAKITKNADQVLVRKIAIRAIIYSIVTLILAALLGVNIIIKNDIPVPILALSGGIILFLVALLSTIKQFEFTKPQELDVDPPTLQVSLYPLTFPIIVTPYGIAAVIVFVILSPDLHSKIIVGAMVLGIMILNLLIMLFAKLFFKPLSIVLAILGGILGVLTVTLGAVIIYKNLIALLAKQGSF